MERQNLTTDGVAKAKFLKNSGLVPIPPAQAPRTAEGNLKKAPSRHTTGKGDALHTQSQQAFAPAKAKTANHSSKNSVSRKT